MEPFCMHYIVIFIVLHCVVAIKNCRNCNRFQEVFANVAYNSRRNNGKESFLPTTATAARHRRDRCCSYDFDSSICRIVDDRILCGYNRNVGNPKSQNIITELSGGCRLIGKRLECGYISGPFTNTRRPPVWDNPPPGFFEDSQQAPKGQANKEGSAGQGQENNVGQIERRDSTNSYVSHRVTRCMEMSGNRIVCREI